MRTVLALVVSLGLSAVLAAQDKAPVVPPRYDVNANPEQYPQGNARQTLESVVKALDRDPPRVDYILAHLADPAYADGLVKQLGSFDEAVRAVRAKMVEDPAAAKELRKFLKEGTFGGGGEQAVVSHKDIPARKIFIKKIGDRWFLENRQKEDK
jgi:hypothetical protein